LGKRYSGEELSLIQELSNEGQTDETIANQLGRSTNAIRNIRHRTNIKTMQTQTIRQLQETKHKLTQQTKKLEHNLKQIQERQVQLQLTLQTQETHFNTKLEKKLIRLKEQNPELFTVTVQDQVNKLTEQLVVSLLLRV